MSVVGRLWRGMGAFREAFLNADVQQNQPGALADFDTFSRWDARKTRYSLYWALWQGNAFRDLVNNWSPGFKHVFGLYQHTRNIFNPVNRIVEFHVNHLMGGRLDPDAGDGDAARSALPILTKNEALRPAIATVWRDSHWQTQKSVWTRWAACLGDSPLFVDDDPERQRVTLRPIHPGHLKWIDRDTAGRVRSYIIEYFRFDPRTPNVAALNPQIDPRAMQRMVRYNEEAFVEDGHVVYRTYLDGALFDWRAATGDGAEGSGEWTVPWDWIPLVCPQHMDVGLPWGIAEPHAFLSKILELDDMASGLGDQIRKRIRAPKMLSGVIQTKGGVSHTNVGNNNCQLQVSPEWGSEKSKQLMPFLYVQNSDAKAHDLTNDLDVPGCVQHYTQIVEELERDFPELQLDVFKTGDPSGRALRIARQRCETKIQERRVSSEAALVQAHKMAIAMGAMRGYAAYAGLGTDPFNDHSLDHEIAHRPVFAPDPLDDVEEGQAFFTMVKTARDAGLPLSIILRREGWDEADIAEIEKANESEQARQVELMRAKAQANPINGNGNGNGNDGDPSKKTAALPVGAGGQ